MKNLKTGLGIFGWVILLVVAMMGIRFGLPIGVITLADHGHLLLARLITIGLGGVVVLFLAWILGSWVNN